MVKLVSRSWQAIAEQDGPLTTGELGEGRFPDGTKADLDLETLRDVHPLGRLKFGEVARQKFGKDGSKVAGWAIILSVRRFPLLT